MGENKQMNLIKRNNTNFCCKKLFWFIAPFFFFSFLSTVSGYGFGLQSIGNDNSRSAERPSIVQGNAPTVGVDHVNANEVGLYKKFEITLNVNAAYSNPYDPDEIDIRAVFTAPSGKQWPVFGFYDNFNSVSKWKIRFAPNEAGEWRYYVTISDTNGTGQSQVHRFTADSSVYHGWIHTSPENLHYFIQDDGTPFYGVGMYSPWGTSISTLDRLKRYGGNIFAVWNIMYGGLISSYGIIESELGKYNQLKSGHIDQLLDLSENRGLKIMFCIWPHDLLSATVWTHQWRKNPYSSICSAEDFFSNKTAWKFQKKQYRYLIARFGYSRSLGIWEIVNEINGTDGWANGRRSEAEEWLRKVNQFFHDNDPYHHPTTASQSGGKSQFWVTGYKISDIPNLHLYEKQGWVRQYPGNFLRSSLKNYAFASIRFWNDFEKPAIIGETGYDNAYFEPGTAGYTAIYHNALWTSLTNGLAMTPFWWQINSYVITDKELQQMNYFSEFTKGIDVVNICRSHKDYSTPDYDAYVMMNDSSGIGWIRQGDGQNISDKPFNIQGLKDGIYLIKWFNTWKGTWLDTLAVRSTDSTLALKTPQLINTVPDLAFYFKKAKNGGRPVKLSLVAGRRRLLNLPGEESKITCMVLDNQGALSADAVIPVTFSLKGPGKLMGEQTVLSQNGIASVLFQADSAVGISEIIASSPGLIRDSIKIEITNKIVIDNFDHYASDNQLNGAWKVFQGTPTTLSLDQLIKIDGNYGLRVNYEVGSSNTENYSGFYKKFKQDWTGLRKLGFWCKPDGSNRTLEIILNAGGADFEADYVLSGLTWTFITIPFSEFSNGSRIDLTSVTGLTIKMVQGSGKAGNGTLYFDSFAALTSISGANRISDKRPSTPLTFQLFQNYPNPFNSSTSIEYVLPRRLRVKISIFNIKGEVIDTIVDSYQDSGTHIVHWTAHNISTGLYFYKIDAGGFTKVRKLIMIK
ncbi:mannan endo-1,4-beta-mannosidase precursor [bacterium BMS3Abin05]|nr:mannan endo-1,4-beta-mannosidase precursor [bacterium BMS3Abin05]